jgi:hypothetical protein
MGWGPDALATEFAGVLENYFAVALVILVQSDTGTRTAHQL